MTFKKFPSIEQFRNIITNVRQHCKKYEKPLPTIRFCGTVKAHGTNAAVGYDKETGKLWCQSRERIITPYDDNAGFAGYVHSFEWYFKRYLSRFEHLAGNPIIYGEWAGGNIQDGVGLNGLPKMFLPFEQAVIGREGELDMRIDPAAASLFAPGDFPITDIPNTYPISMFGTYEIYVDFNSPQDVQNKLVEMTLAVETECPIAKHFGVSGVGEGIVWSADIGTDEPVILRFKVKGEKHSTSKVRTVATISEEDLARMKTVDAFVDTVCTENRMAQGLDKLREMGLALEMRSIGEYLKWVGQDILKEEMDLIEAAALDRKELMPKVTAKAKQYFMNAMNAALAEA